MMTLALLLLLAGQPSAPAPAAPPASEAARLARQLAESEALAALLPMIQARETDDLVAAHPELSPSDQARFRSTAARVFAEGRDRLLAASARSYAEQLSLEELRALVAFHTSAAAQRHRAAMPAAIMAGAASMQGRDFKRDARAAFCAETGLTCPK